MTELPRRPIPVTPAAGRPRRQRRVRTAHDLRRLRRQVLTIVLSAGSFVLLVNALVGESGYLAGLRAEQEYEALSASVARLDAENAEYLRQIDALKHDPAALEEAVRRVLGYARPGELVVIVRDARPAPTLPPPQ